MHRMDSLPSYQDQTEWLETDGMGGFASGTVGGIRTRHYHGLLLAALQPPDRRMMLVNGVEAFVTTSAGTFALSSQRYGGDVVQPDGYRFIVSFNSEPWPTWRYRLTDGTQIEQRLVVLHGSPTVAMQWRLIEGPHARLTVRPLMSGRDYHALHHENPSLRSDATIDGERVSWQTYSSMPVVYARSNGQYAHAPLWYRNFFYQEDSLRGYEANEDLASPGEFQFDLATAQANLLLTTDAASAGSFDELWDSERKRRAAFASPLHRAADQYIVQRGEGRTIIAGYPWFCDWGRDSFISLRGLCLATGRLEIARQILVSWSSYVSQGMLPNRFPEDGNEPEYNSVDAALWYIIAVYEFLAAAEKVQFTVESHDRRALEGAIDAILSGYSAGTRYGIRVDRDGLLAAGAPGVQLTWMDAKVGDWVVTPRIGKPVEVQALWLNALDKASSRSSQWQQLCAAGCASFRRRFWNEATGCLYDVVDCDHVSGTTDASFRPNQLFAVGGLPLMLVPIEQAKRIVEQVEKRLWTPMGLRSLAPGEKSYAGRYIGGLQQRDAVYHQGTVWPWLAGAFIDAWVRVNGNDANARAEAKSRFVDVLLRQLHVAGLGHLSEIADGDPPHTPRGCPFQAWSVGELLRVLHVA